MFRKHMRPNEIRPMSWQPNASIPFAKYTKLLPLFLLTVLLLMLLGGCSKAVSVTPMPLPPANLAFPCQMLQTPPNPLVDPERALWEVDTVAKYADCSVKHRLTVEAWKRAVEAR